MFIVWILLAVAALAVVWRFVIRPALRGSALPPDDATCEITERGGDVIRHDCGHDGHKRFKISVWGKPLIEAKQEGPRKFCADCLLSKILKETVRCAICGGAIFPGQPVALVVDDRDFRERKWRRIVDGQVVCCLSGDCDAGFAFVGSWTGDGIKYAFPEGRTMIGHTFATGESTHVQFGGDKEGA